MKADMKILNILERSQAGHSPTREECRVLLECRPVSAEAGFLRAVADTVSRCRFGNASIILGQIGVEIEACPGGCKFCSFGEGHTAFVPSQMSQAEVLAGALDFTAGGNLFALFLMTMHTFDFGHLLDTVHLLRERLPLEQQIVVNVGDFDRVQAEELHAAGVNGAYHVLRLREGEDTALDPQQRRRTIEAVRAAGLDWYYCCEPVGPEHSAAELVEQIFLGIELGCFQHAAMRRVYIPGSPLSGRGQISELRLAQVVAVVALASLGCRETTNIAVHEPNLIGLTSGANAVYAETGANPRDTEKDTSYHRGRDVDDCRVMLYEAGFTNLIAADRGLRPLDRAYRR